MNSKACASMAMSTAMLMGVLASEAHAQVPFRSEIPLAPSDGTGDVAVVASRGWPGAERVVYGHPLRSGLFVYGLDGGLTSVVSSGLGPFSGVDALSLSEGQGAYVAATASVAGQVLLLRLTESGDLVSVLARELTQFNAGPVALSAPVAGRLELLYAGAASRTLRRAVLFDAGAGQWDHVGGAAIELPGEPTALEVDSRARRLYAIVPWLGVVVAELDGVDAPRVLEPVSEGNLGGQPFGLALYALSDGGTVLLVSVPSRNELVAFGARADGLDLLTRFGIALDGGDRAVRQPQHLAVTTVEVAGSPGGVLVVHDLGNGGLGASYKVVDLALAAEHTSPPLPVDAPGLLADGGRSPDGGGAGGGNPGGPSGGGWVGDGAPRACSCGGAGQPRGSLLSGAVCCGLWLWRRRPRGQRS